MSNSVILIFTILFILVNINVAFLTTRSVSKQTKSVLKMEYIPDGLTKAQWELIKKQEEEERKAKGNLGAMGVNRFKSRSFEAWQKSGAKHLFPVNPNEVPYEERPYMQRRGGDWEGNDLKNIGLEGKGQGQAAKRLKVDNLYEVAEKEGRLNSVSIFGGLPLPWSSSQVGQLNSQLDINKAKAEKGTPGVAGKKLSEAEMARLKATLAKPISKQKQQQQQSQQQPTMSSSQEKKESPEKPAKKFFGLF